MIIWILVAISSASAGIFEDNMQKMRDSKRYPEIIKIQIKRAEIELNREKPNCNFVVKLLTDLLRDSENQKKYFSIENFKTISIYIKQYELCFDPNGGNVIFDEQFYLVKNSYYFEDYLKAVIPIVENQKINSKLAIVSNVSGYFSKSKNSLILRSKIIPGVNEYIIKNELELDNYLLQSLSLAKSVGNHGTQD
jgi:hypothetical protein